MSDEYFKELAESVKSGQYFEDAKQWYSDKYLNPVIDRAYSIFIGFLALVAAFCAFALLYSFLPLKMYKPVFVDMADQSQTYSTFRALGNRTNIEEDPQAELQKYLLEKFISAYEGYDFRNDFGQLKVNETVLGNLGTPEVLEEYKNYTSPTNPESPMLRLRNKAILIAEVKKGSFRINRISTGGAGAKDAPSSYSATVDFVLHERSVQGTVKSTWRTKIGFLYRDIRYDKREQDFTPMEFKVTSYASEKIQ